MKIALMGYARSGKDTVYEIMSDNLKGGTCKLVFGEALKKYAHEITLIPTTPKPRWLYEEFGEAMRKIEPNVWVNHVDYAYMRADAIGCENFIVTDLRQPNEAQWCIDNGFKIVMVECDPMIRKGRSKGDTNWLNINPSEMEIETLHRDFTIYNNFDVHEELEQRVLNLLKEVRKP